MQKFEVTPAASALEALRREQAQDQDGVETIFMRPVAAAAGGGYPDNNPKTAMGAKKPDLSVVPPSALLHLATAMMNGAEKYGPFNWRDQPVSARTYVAAAMRHLLAYLDGEDFSADTVETGVPVHHLAHVMACCGIILDATAVGTIADNRPNVHGPAGQMIEMYNKLKRFTLQAVPAGETAH